MGRCHEFGSQIREGCGHPMRAGERACSCPECGVVCQGLFDGCPDVWARGPRPITLTTVAALGGNGARPVRALTAGPAPSREEPPPPPPPPPPPTNGFTGAQQQPPPHVSNNGAPSGQGGASRTEVLNWFEDAFDDLRNELHAVVSTVTRQQAMLAELLDAREAELRVVVLAESLPDLAGEAAAKALAEESGGLADMVSGYLEDFRLAVQASEESSASVMDGMRELLQRVELTAELNTEEARVEGAAHLDALKASVARQLRPVAADIAALAAEVDAAQEREAARTRALKAAMTRQLQPLTARLDAAIERSDEQLADIRARLDALGPAGGPTLKPKTRRRPSATPRG
ncbi:MAG TPA: hypothetical protein VHT97_07350 [Acidimicrobiales bacterium]|jgi:hypothetical protein|nr:hypothetical protein [Acidimicrobiales bacterium]